MMLKALGIEFDPQMFEKLGEGVVEIRDRLRRIEEKLDLILEGKQNGIERVSVTVSGSSDDSGGGGGNGSSRKRIGAD